jgi:hypothetical protein
LRRYKHHIIHIKFIDIVVEISETGDEAMINNSKTQYASVLGGGGSKKSNDLVQAVKLTCDVNQRGRLK